MKPSEMRMRDLRPPVALKASSERSRISSVVRVRTVDFEYTSAARASR
jgi:hypothetical protein